MKTIVLSDAAYAELVAAIVQPGPVVTPPITPPVTPPVTPARGTTYPIGRLTNDDKRWLIWMQTAYRSALASIRGSHQLFEDMLADERGRTVTGAPPNDALQARINVIKNAASAGGELYDPAYRGASYAGPLLAVYAALVAAKKAGK